MNIVQSFWTAPDTYKNGGYLPVYKMATGWRSPKHHFMAWALSCLSLKKFHKKVILHTDSYGKWILCDLLKLPYDEVVVSLDEIEHMSNFWAYGKIWTYALQKEPFVHVDGDIFVNSPILTNEKTDLIIQNEENNLKYYQEPLAEIKNNFVGIPQELLEHCKNSITAYNCGFMGGYNLDLLKNYASRVIEFISQNASFSPQTNVAVIYEQTLLRAFSDKQNAKVKVLLHSGSDTAFYQDVGDVWGFLKGEKTFIHALGYWKKSEIICRFIENQLMLHYPKYYYRINKFSHNHII